MPEQTGVELLKHVRARYPAIVRILTTAYSDLDDAIEAVNSGEIYRYITKPWDINDLRAELVRAMELYVLRRERDLLLAEKLSVLQRKLAVDRARDLLTFASALPGLRNAVPAIWDFIRQGLADGLSGVADPKADVSGLAHWAALESEILRSRTVFRMASVELATLRDSTFSDSLRPVELLADGLQAARARGDIRIESSISAERPVRCRGRSARRLFELVIKRLLQEATVSTTTVSVRTQESAAETTLIIEASGTQPFEPRDQASEVETLGEMLSAYLIAGHHGGSVAFERPGNTMSRFTVVLPANPEAVEARPLPDGWLEQVFSRYEDWSG
jgi:two-component system probable response regulator PhcQ